MAMQKIDRFLKLMNDRGASDFHMTVGRPPMLRSSGTIESIRYRTLSEADFREMLKPVTPERLWDEYLQNGDIDFSYEIPGVARYRVNLFRQQRAVVVGSGALVVEGKLQRQDGSLSVRAERFWTIPEFERMPSHDFR